MRATAACNFKLLTIWAAIGCPVFLFFRYHLALLTRGANRVKNCVSKKIPVFDDGNLTISALKVAEIAKKCRKFFLSDFYDVIFKICGIKSRS